MGITFAVMGFFVTAQVLMHQELLTADLTAKLHDDWRFEMSEKTAEMLLSLPSSARNVAMTSRSAMVDAGFSPGYLDTHVFLDHVLPDGDGGWIVQWVFSAGDRTIPLIDRLAAGGDGSLVSSLQSQLGQAHDVMHVLSFDQSQSALYACLGQTEGEVVRLGTPTPEGPMLFALHARSRDGSLVGYVNLETGECSRGASR